MSEGLNKVMLLGNLAADPELKFTQGGMAVLNMRLVTNTNYMGKDNERKEQVEYHTVKVWGKRAEGLNKILSKGKKLLIEGKLTTRSWEDKNGGGKRYATEINADNVLLCDGKLSGGQRDAETRERYSDDTGGGSTDDDIPFAQAENWRW